MIKQKVENNSYSIVQEIDVSISYILMDLSIKSLKDIMSHDLLAINMNKRL